MKAKLLVSVLLVFLLFSTCQLNHSLYAETNSIYILTNAKNNFQQEYRDKLKDLKNENVTITDTVPEIGLIEIKNNKNNRNKLRDRSFKETIYQKESKNSHIVNYSKSQSWDMQLMAKSKDAKKRIKSGGRKIKVGVLDSGVSQKYKKTHPNILPSSKNFVGNISENEKGRSDDISDRVGHGTQVLSQLAGSDQNQGIIPNAKFNVYRIYSSNTVKSTWALKGIIQSAKNNDDILNISSGKYLLISGKYKNGGNDKLEFEAWQRAINYATTKGTLVVSSIGEENINENNNDQLKKVLNKRQKIYNNKGIVKDVPSQLNNVVSIGSLNPENKISSFSNRSTKTYYTPGGGLELYKKYGLKNYTKSMIEKELIPVYGLDGPTYSYGTSLSSPKAAGVIGHLIEKESLYDNPKLTQEYLNLYKKQNGNKLSLDKLMKNNYHIDYPIKKAN
uniref:NsjP S8 family serine protease n=1 Tax=Staphylococcus capitis TaxID=29388 RepID=A0A650A8R5_STACP|nr:S8 family serine peptidase [Staphylococcus capitis]QGN18868.1 nsjP S8 family serine protease [Staphylococcus capitis]